VSIRRNRKATTLAIKATELAVAAPVVAAHRLTRMALAGHAPSRRDHREFRLMGTEKVAAFHESWNAMFNQSIRIQQEIVASMWRSFWSPWLNAGSFAAPPRIDLQHAALRVLSTGMTPVHRRAVANAKRFTRTGTK
jgi:hypothetical protein